MIPPDVAGRLQATADVALRPVAPAQELTDKLSEFSVGQRLMAQVQALLPNGTYRALVNQRSITLALPFSARSGDALELEVVESDGKLALAVIAQRRGGAEKEAVSATLSRTAQLISRLFSGADGAEREAKALPLNGNRPIAGTPPGNAQDLLPLLRQAIGRSGMFYESHQAEWVEGRFAKTELLEEPQGKLSKSASPGAETASNSAANPASTARAGVAADAQANRAGQSAAQQETDSASARKGMGEAASRTAGEIVAPQARGIVHQQLSALANQTFVWQGQIWPGQDMRWEIEEDGQNRQEEDEAAPGWRTRLDLSFPVLGDISVKLQLQGSQVSLSLDVNNEASLERLRADAETLRQRLEDAGLVLASLGMAPSAERETR
jgi:hypothetical protein